MAAVIGGIIGGVTYDPPMGDNTGYNQTSTTSTSFPVF